jgi:uncharacterized membrane protein YdjX (TVP38/TMEM64 family)
LAAQEERKRRLWHLLPLLIVLILAFLAYALGLHAYFRFHALRTYRYELLDFVAERYFLAVLLFLVSETVAIGLSMPVDALFAVTAGFLFRQPWATIYSVVAATVGALIIFVIVRAAMTAAWRARTISSLSYMEAGFQKNAASYLLCLRLIPFSPFWFINLVAAFFNVRLSTFAWTTLVGIIPTSFVHAEAGRGLNAIFESGENFSFRSVFNAQVITALIGLALLSLVPIGIRWIRDRHKK